MLTDPELFATGAAVADTPPTFALAGVANSRAIIGRRYL